MVLGADCCVIWRRDTFPCTDVQKLRLNAHTQVLISKHSHMTKKGKEELRQELPLVCASLSARRYDAFAILGSGAVLQS